MKISNVIGLVVLCTPMLTYGDNQEEFPLFNNDLCRHDSGTAIMVLKRVKEDKHKSAQRYFAKLHECHKEKKEHTDEMIASGHLFWACRTAKILVKIIEAHLPEEDAEAYRKYACSCDPLWCLGHGLKHVLD